jgi:RNA-directed DNA polymerase
MCEADIKAFLSSKSPNLLARYLLDQPYRRFQKLLYPNLRYTTFHLPKRTGGNRTIDAPGRILKDVQRKLARVLLDMYGTGRPSVHSFLRGRSIRTNAEAHSGRKNFVFNVDLSDFFGTINFGRVRGLFRKPPFSFPDSVSSILAHICCYRQRLPQGAPTSPILANWIARSLDADLQALARIHSATYTRYSDDITFSFSVKASSNLPAGIVNVSGTPTVGDTLAKIIAKHSFRVNEKKVRLRSRNQRLEVTGLTVNKFPNVRRRFVDEIRGALHAWEAHGIDAARTAFPKRYRRALRSGKTPSFERVIRGKLFFLRMVRGPDDQIYLRLAEKFNALATRDKLSIGLPIVRRARDNAGLRKSVFVVECHDEKLDLSSQGTAFYVEGIGLITCEHVLRRNSPSSKAEIQYFGQVPGDRIEVSNRELAYIDKPVTILFVDFDADVAILGTPSDFPSDAMPLHLRLSSPERGELARLAGFPNYSPGRELTVVDSQVLATYQKHGRARFEILATIRKGNSGGPILDKDFFVLGHAIEGATQEAGNNEALVALELKKLFDSVDTKPKAGKGDVGKT